jgi:hypothetical protein
MRREPRQMLRRFVEELLLARFEHRNPSDRRLTGVSKPRVIKELFA